MIASTSYTNRNNSDTSNSNGNESNKNKLSLKKQTIASIIGGMVTASTVTPLDVVKTRLQTSTKNKNAITGTIETFIKISRNEGISTLWRGLGPSLLMTIPSSTIYFTTYEHLKQFFNSFSSNNKSNQKDRDNHNRLTIPLLAGSLARVISATVTSPIELIRTNSQGVVREGTRYSSLVLYREIVSNVGISGLWRGFGPTLLRDVPFSALYWSGYEITKEILLKKKYSNDLSEIDYNKTPFYINFISGAVSGTIAAIVTTPIDVIKTRIQMTVQQSNQSILNNKTNNSTGSTNTNTNGNGSSSSSNNNKIFQSSSPTQQFKMILEKEGWVGFTKGMVPRVAKISPACAIMVSTYEWVKSVDF